MHIRNLNAEITHTGDNVEIKFNLPAGEFVRFVDSLRKPASSPRVATPIMDTIPARKERFYSKVKQYQVANPTKYPSELYVKFATYWMESSPDGKRLRFESQKFFDVGRRLATFWTRCDKMSKDEMWSQEKKTYSPMQKSLL